MDRHIFSSGSAESVVPEATDGELLRIILDVLRRRGLGESVTDDEVIARHPHLMPELSEKLRRVAVIHHSSLRARGAGQIDDSFEVMDSAALEAPLTITRLSETDAAPVDRPTTSARPRIDGYRILQELGAGGQATVFKAVQESTGRAVAIKVILGGSLAGAKHRARFDREVDILAKLEHPNVTGVIDCGYTSDGSRFFTMDFIDGLPLDQFSAAENLTHATDGEKLPTLVNLWISVARAVSDAHALGIVHRDVKPSNVLVDRSGRPHVLDFGLATVADDTLSRAPRLELTTTGPILGSLPWASPEQVQGRASEVDARSDVYSLGVMAYQTWTGAFPYDVDDTVPEVVANITTAVPIAPSMKLTSSPRPRWSPGHRRLIESLDQVILKALAKRPEDRHASATAFADELEACLAGRLKSTPRPSRRRRRILLALAAFLVICGVIIAWQLRAPRTATPTFKNSAGIQFVRIASGIFTIGSAQVERGRRADEKPRLVSISPGRWISTTEVTQAKYCAVMGINPSDPRFLGDDLPVQCVSWEQAALFCKKLGELDGRTYRLPTEAEWEVACRAGADNPPPQRAIDAFAWHAGNAGATVHAVGNKKPNDWGLYDMTGNVAEWCLDWYQADFGDTSRPALDPTGPTTGSSRVVRGGAANSDSADCRPSARAKHTPDTRSPFIGFRVVLVAEQ